MKTKFCLYLVIIALLVSGCYGNNRGATVPTINSLNTSNIELHGKMDITNIIYIEPVDDNTVYIIGAKRDKSMPARELVYGVCYFDTEEVVVLHREVASIDRAHNMAVFRDISGIDRVFTGQHLLTVDKKKLISIEYVSENRKEAYIDIENKRIAYTAEEPPSLFCQTFDSSEKYKIASSSEKIEESGNHSILFPHDPKIKGDKIIYGISKDDTSNYQKVMISRVDGTPIAETEQLVIRADYLEFLWCGNGFITLEKTDSFEKSPNGMATIFTSYDSNAKQVSKTTFEGMAQSCQRKFYKTTPYYLFGYENNNIRGISLFDSSLNKAYFIEAVKGHVISPTITPSGGNIIWCNNGFLERRLMKSIDKSKELSIIK